MHQRHTWCVQLIALFYIYSAMGFNYTRSFSSSFYSGSTSIEKLSTVMLQSQSHLRRPKCGYWADSGGFFSGEESSCTCLQSIINCSMASSSSISILQRKWERSESRQSKRRHQWMCQSPTASRRSEECVVSTGSDKSHACVWCHSDIKDFAFGLVSRLSPTWARTTFCSAPTVTRRWKMTRLMSEKLFWRTKQLITSISDEEIWKTAKNFLPTFLSNWELSKEEGEKSYSIHLLKKVCGLISIVMNRARGMFPFSKKCVWY